jgi:TetR/AcrR family transcriptional regulator
VTAQTPSSKDAILDAAEARFARQGYDSTTIKEIAADAEVNSALLYYYFAGKEDLYGAVVARMIHGIADAMSKAVAGLTDPEAAVHAFASRHLALLESRPHVRKLIGRELIDHDAAHAQDAIRHMAATIFDRLQGAIAAGQRAGLFRTDMDPRFVAISLVAQTTYFHLARPAVEILVAGGKPIPAATTAAFGEHVARFTLAALRPAAPAAGASA